MEISILSENSQHLEAIINLSNDYRETLGFLPAGAFYEFARKGQVLAAIQNNELAGYLLFASNSRDELVYITQLCTHPKYRKMGVSRDLFCKLEQLTKDLYRGVRVTCRRDFEVNKMWPKFGFVPKNEKPGRSKKGSVLCLWWYDFGHPSLFAYTSGQSSEKSVVAIDTNIFFDLHDLRDKPHQEAKVLQSDWIQDCVELVLTDEVHNDIDVEKNYDRKVKAKSLISKYRTIHCKPMTWQKNKEALKNLFSNDFDEKSHSDIKHLAKAISADIKFFITRDDELLKKYVKIYDLFGLRVIRPSDFIVQQDELLRGAEYEPARLASANIQLKKIGTKEIVSILEDFYEPQKEKKTELKNKINHWLANPRKFESKIIQDAGGANYGALIYEVGSGGHILDVVLFRAISGSMSTTIAHCLIKIILKQAAANKIQLIRIKDNSVSVDFEKILKSSGFISSKDEWFKFNIYETVNIVNLLKKITALKKDWLNYAAYLSEIEEGVGRVGGQDLKTFLRIENLFWPLKISDLNIPTYIVPIKPFWGMHLFEESLASKDLWGGDPKLIFTSENVYYRSAKPRIITSPSRVMWYVSSDQPKFDKTMHISAMSYVEEVFVDKPKTLFSRFRRLGVYDWRNVYAVADNNIDKDIMAFRFSGTELFKTPISLEDLRIFWNEETGKKFSIQGPVKISNSLFFKLYKKGN